MAGAVIVADLLDDVRDLKKLVAAALGAKTVRRFPRKGRREVTRG